MFKKILTCSLVIALFTLKVAATEKKFRVLILWSGLAEYEWCQRLQTACGRLGWVCEAAYPQEDLSSFEKSVLRIPLNPLPIESMIDRFKPDFILSLKKDKIYHPKIPHYLALSGCKIKYFSGNFEGCKQIFDFAGILYAPSSIAALNQNFQANGKKLRAIPWYPSCAATEFDPPIPQKLFFCGFQWDKQRNGKEFRLLFSLLDQTGYFEVYGPPNNWKCAPNSHQGLLPFDGKSVCQAIREAGIALVLHSPLHIKLGAPTARIFEAISSCSIVISDLHPFVMQEFGDSVLYVDHRQNGQELFRQIDSHVKWIFEHPEEAEEMAQRAHAIFLEKFTLESHLERLAQLHLSRKK